jgi:hypothetical protein
VRGKSSQQRNTFNARRFHRHPKDRVGKLRAWDLAIWQGLHATLPEMRFAANLLSDGLRVIYRSKLKASVERELNWVGAVNGKGNPGITQFADLCELFDLEPQAVMADIFHDVRAGLIVAKGIACAKADRT